MKSLETSLEVDILALQRDWKKITFQTCQKQKKKTDILNELDDKILQKEEISKLKI